MIFRIIYSEIECKVTTFFWNMQIFLQKMCIIHSFRYIVICHYFMSMSTYNHINIPSRLS